MAFNEGESDDHISVANPLVDPGGRAFISTIVTDNASSAAKRLWTVHHESVLCPR
jgi:hypothetical protein